MKVGDLVQLCWMFGSMNNRANGLVVDIRTWIDENSGGRNAGRIVKVLWLDGNIFAYDYDDLLVITKDENG